MYNNAPNKKNAAVKTTIPPGGRLKSILKPSGVKSGGKAVVSDEKKKRREEGRRLMDCVEALSSGVEIYKDMVLHDSESVLSECPDEALNGVQEVVDIFTKHGDFCKPKNVYNNRSLINNVGLRHNAIVQFRFKVLKNSDADTVLGKMRVNLIKLCKETTQELRELITGSDQTFQQFGRAERDKYNSNINKLKVFLKDYGSYPEWQEPKTTSDAESVADLDGPQSLTEPLKKKQEPELILNRFQRKNILLDLIPPFMALSSFLSDGPMGESRGGGIDDLCNVDETEIVKLLGEILGHLSSSEVSLTWLNDRMSQSRIDVDYLKLLTGAELRYALKFNGVDFAKARRNLYILSKEFLQEGEGKRGEFPPSPQLNYDSIFSANYVRDDDISNFVKDYELIPEYVGLDLGTSASELDAGPVLEGAVVKNPNPESTLDNSFVSDVSERDIGPEKGGLGVDLVNNPNGGGAKSSLGLDRELVDSSGGLSRELTWSVSGQNIESDLGLKNFQDWGNECNANLLGNSDNGEFNNNMSDPEAQDSWDSDTEDVEDVAVNGKQGARDVAGLGARTNTPPASLVANGGRNLVSEANLPSNADDALKPLRSSEKLGGDLDKSNKSNAKGAEFLGIATLTALDKLNAVYTNLYNAFWSGTDVGSQGFAKSDSTRTLWGSGGRGKKEMADEVFNALCSASFVELSAANIAALCTPAMNVSQDRKGSWEVFSSRFIGRKKIQSALHEMCMRLKRVSGEVISIPDVDVGGHCDSSGNSQLNLLRAQLRSFVESASDLEQSESESEDFQSMSQDDKVSRPKVLDNTTGKSLGRNDTGNNTSREGSAAAPLGSSCVDDIAKFSDKSLGKDKDIAHTMAGWNIGQTKDATIGSTFKSVKSLDIKDEDLGSEGGDSVDNSRYSQSNAEELLDLCGDVFSDNSSHDTYQNSAFLKLYSEVFQTLYLVYCSLGHKLNESTVDGRLVRAPKLSNVSKDGSDKVKKLMNSLCCDGLNLEALASSSEAALYAMEDESCIAWNLLVKMSCAGSEDCNADELQANMANMAKNLNQIALDIRDMGQKLDVSYVENPAVSSFIRYYQQQNQPKELEEVDLGELERVGREAELEDLTHSPRGANIEVGNFVHNSECPLEVEDISDALSRYDKRENQGSGQAPVVESSGFGGGSRSVSSGYSSPDSEKGAKVDSGAGDYDTSNAILGSCDAARKARKSHSSNSEALSGSGKSGSGSSLSGSGDELSPRSKSEARMDNGGVEIRSKVQGSSSGFVRGSVNSGFLETSPPKGLASSLGGDSGIGSMRSVDNGNDFEQSHSEHEVAVVGIKSLRALFRSQKGLQATASKAFPGDSDTLSISNVKRAVERLTDNVYEGVKDSYRRALIQTFNVYIPKDKYASKKSQKDALLGYLNSEGAKLKKMNEDDRVDVVRKTIFAKGSIGGLSLMTVHVAKRVLLSYPSALKKHEEYLDRKRKGGNEDEEAEQDFQGIFESIREIVRFVNDLGVELKNKKHIEICNTIREPTMMAWTLFKRRGVELVKSEIIREIFRVSNDLGSGLENETHIEISETIRQTAKTARGPLRRRGGRLVKSGTPSGLGGTSLGGRSPTHYTPETGVDCEGDGQEEQLFPGAPEGRKHSLRLVGNSSNTVHRRTMGQSARKKDTFNNRTDASQETGEGVPVESGYVATEDVGSFGVNSAEVPGEGKEGDTVADQAKSSQFQLRRPKASPLIRVPNRARDSLRKGPKGSAISKPEEDPASKPFGRIADKASFTKPALAPVGSKSPLDSNRSFKISSWPAVPGMVSCKPLAKNGHEKGMLSAKSESESESEHTRSEESHLAPRSVPVKNPLVSSKSLVPWSSDLSSTTASAAFARGGVRSKGSAVGGMSLSGKGAFRSVMSSRGGGAPQERTRGARAILVDGARYGKHHPDKKSADASMSAK